MNKIILLILASLALVGCNTTQPLYYHGEHNHALYHFFKAEEANYSEQISLLQEIVIKAGQKGRKVAPGVHAQLGLLFFETGQTEQGIEHFEIEKKLFPESEQYLNYLLHSAKEV